MTVDAPHKTIHARDALRLAITWFDKHPSSMLITALPGSLFGVAAFLFALRGDLPGLNFLFNLASLLAGEITSAALFYAMFLTSMDRPFTPASSYERVFDRLGPLIAYTARLFGAVFLLCITIIGIPWGIRVLVRWFFGAQIIILTEASPKEAISHSCRLVNGVWWQIFRIFMLLLLLFIPSLIVTVALPGAAGGLVSALIGFLVTPFFAGFWTAIYLQLEEQERAASLQPAAP